MEVYVVVPTYNERENISRLVPKVFAELRTAGVGGHMVVVDDNSPDGTAAAAEALGEKYPVSVIRRPEKLGIGSAYVAGFKEAIASGADVIFEIDADLSHDPRHIRSLLAALEGADIAIGSRYVAGGRIEGWGVFRRLVSAVANLLARASLGLSVRDATSGYRAYRRSVIESLDLDGIESSGYVFQAEILYQARRRGFRVKETPILFSDRKRGKSKLSGAEIASYAAYCAKTFFSRLSNPVKP